MWDPFALKYVFSAFKGLPTAEMDSLLLRISSALIAAYAHPDSRSF